MFIANNSIFKSIMQYSFSQINKKIKGVLKECYLMMNFEKKINVPFLKYQ